jgi:type II secretory pathway component GspD/PulD (secretin)
MKSMKIQVRNGEKGTMRFNQSVPMQWVESAQAASAQSGATVRQALVWFDAGQTLSVLPRWSGGSNAPVVELEVHQSGMQDGMKADLPNQIHSRLASTVTAPLAQWVTVAASGGSAPKQGSYSSDSSGQARRLLQLRVLVP